MSLIVCGIGLVLPSAAAAVEIPVTTDADEFNSNPAACSLREAVWAANNDSNTMAPGCVAGSGADRVDVPAGTFVLTLTGAAEDADQSGDLDIVGADTMVSGAGARATIVDAAGIDRVFHVLGGGEQIANLTARGGVSASGLNRDGGGIYIEPSASLILADATVRDNTALPALGTPQGGGIDNEGSLSVLRSTVSDNKSSGSFGATGGGIFSGGPITIDDSTVSRNVATAPNSASGGGVVTGAATAQIFNSTIAYNSAVSGVPTTAGNISSGSNTVLRGSIIAYGKATDGANCNPFNGTGFTSLGGNLRANTFPIPDDGCNAVSPAAGDIVVFGDARLAGPADNGGPTDTVALLPKSPAIDALKGCPPPAVDQRGVARPVGGACDIGAFETTNPPTPPAPNCLGKRPTIVGSASSDTIKGTRKADVIQALSGDDRIQGLGGRDRLCGGAGDDRIAGGRAGDRISGAMGKDVLLGGPGRDRLLGGPGRDTLNGGPAHDRLRGGPGRDHQSQS